MMMLKCLREFLIGISQRGGSMDFWDKLSESRKRIARECVAKILEAPDEG